MRILIQDYSGHPFQVQLSRELARRGHQVLHLYAGFFQTPRGRLHKLASDPDNFHCRSINLSKPFPKYSFFRRRMREIEYGKLLIKEVENFSPETVISSNTPLDSQQIFLKKCKRDKINFVFWLQDLYGVAIKNILTRKLSILGRVIGDYYQRLEMSLLRNSDKIVVITEDFVDILELARVQHDKIHVIENWAPLEDLPEYPKNNNWAKKHGLHNTLCILYSGTLGLKHNPEVLLSLAIKLKERGDVKIVVISEGLGADFLKSKKEGYNLNNLVLFDFQPFELLPQILAAADILIAILEEDAGIFSVPSKVLTYHCGGRSLLLSVPANNLAARIVEKNQTGIIVNPRDQEGFIQTAEKLLNNETLRQFYGTNARKYAQETFNIEKITDKFENLIRA